MVEQPNDVRHCHKAIKACYKGDKYNESKAWEVPAYLVGFDSTLSNAGIERGSIKLYWKALCHMEICLSKTCTIPMIKAGYIISEIYPVDNNEILAGWSGWSFLSKEKGDDIIRLLPTLTDIVKVNGRVTDGAMAECMGHVIDFDVATRKSNDCAMNHGRCLWTNNINVVYSYKARQAAVMNKGIIRDNKQMEAEWRLNSPKRAASWDKRVRDRSGIVSETAETRPAKRHRQFRCSNSGCKLSANTIERRLWSKCKSKTCALFFCPNCIASLTTHQDICDKSVRSDFSL